MLKMGCPHKNKYIRKEEKDVYVAVESCAL
jgi:hypothetical protein